MRRPAFFVVQAGLRPLQAGSGDWLCGAWRGSWAASRPTSRPAPSKDTEKARLIRPGQALPEFDPLRSVTL